MYSLYTVSAEDIDYDEYDEVTVIAQDEDEALKEARGFFSAHQFPLTVARICGTDATSAFIVATSFNAG